MSDNTASNNAALPEALRYTAEHEWVTSDDPATVGITAHAVEELGDLVWLELPAVGDMVEAGSVCGEIESTKAVSELYAPLTGEIVEINAAAVDSPEIISTAPYGEGWLFKISTTDTDTELLSAEAYAALL